MRIPVEWLNEYVPNTLSVRELAFVLTNVGLEVEAIEETAATAVLDVKVTPNRGDCLSVEGMARELAMALRAEMRDREPEVSESGPPASGFANVLLEDRVLCPRYSARIVRNVEIAASPPWAQRRLELCGIRPINNVVDATNLVMLELGQPLHAFDRQLLRGAPGEGVPEIVVRRARPGERLVTIDGEERDLSPEVLLITDTSGPIALAGIMGGSSTEIHDGTTEVLLESAHFNAGVVRRGARALGVSTEASYRFERTVDPGGTVRALDRACELIAEFCGEGVEVCRGVVDAYPNPIEDIQITVRPPRVNALLGIELSAEEMSAYLSRLRLGVEREGETLLVRAPTFRQDLRTEVDVIEEVARAHGYENIPEAMPQASAGVGGLPASLRFERELRHLLRGLGLSEAVTSSLESPQSLARLGLPEEDVRSRPVRIANWKTADRSQLRTTLLTSLLEVIAHNSRHGVEAVSIFHIGRVYLAGSQEELPQEPRHLGIAVMGTMTPGLWQVPEEVAGWDFYALKGVVENVVRAAARTPGDFAADSPPALEPGRAARVALNGEEVGFFGEVSREVLEAYDVPEPVFVAELDLDTLSARAGEPARYRPVSRYPGMTRDVAFLVSREVQAAKAEAIIAAAAGDDLESLHLFDAYEGRPLPDDRRNLAFSLTFRRPDRTLTDAEVEATMERVRAALVRELKARIRK